MEFGRRRWICYIASLLIIVCAGFQYSLSVFQIPLADRYGWSISEIAFSYSILSVAEIIAVIFLTGKLRTLLGIQKFLILGGLFFGGSTLLCSFIAGSIFELYLYQGVMLGIGNAIIYPCLTSYVIQIIPERSGFFSGLVIALYACGPLIWAPLSAFISDSTGDISTTFRIIGVILLFSIIVLALMLKEAPAGYKGNENKKDESKKEPGIISTYNVSRKEMIKKPIFYLFYLTFFIGLLGGTMVLTQGATIFENGLKFHATIAASIFGIISVCNAFGRISCGYLSDKINKLIIMRVLFVLYAIAFGIMSFVNVPTIFVIAAGVSLFCFGGFAAALAPMTSQLFGMNHITENFGLVFTVYSVAGFLAPVLVTNIRDISGSYSIVFLFAMILSIIGIFCCELLRKRLVQ